MTGDKPGHHPIWELSDMAWSEDAPEDRWIVDLQWMNPDSWPFALGMKVTALRQPVVAFSETAECFQDMAWGDSCAHVVSTRLRHHIERTLPEHAQFFPLVIKYGKKRPRVISDGDHWLTNWHRCVDCFSTAKSDYRVSTRSDGTWSYSSPRPVLELARIPQEVKVFHVKNMPVTVVARDEVRRSFEAEGFTGIQWRRIWYV